MNGIPNPLIKHWKNKIYAIIMRREIKLLQSYNPKFNEDTKM